MSQLQGVTDFFGNTPQTDLTSQDVENVIDELNRSNASVNVLGQVFNIATILNETYTFTSADALVAYANISFPHGLSFVPIVNGSVTNKTDGSIRILPATVHQSSASFFGKSFNISIVVESVDEFNVNLRIDVIDAQGATIVAIGSIFTFILYCQQQIAATT